MFRDRRHAGMLLGERLLSLRLVRPVVLGLPRGGVVVAAEVARALGAPLDVLVVRKLGAPGNPELGIGAIAEGGITVHNDGLIARLGVPRAELEAVTAREAAELERRTRAYRRGRPPIAAAGLHRGRGGRRPGHRVHRPGGGGGRPRPAARRRVVLAVPVAAPETAAEFAALVDRVVCVGLARLPLRRGRLLCRLLPDLRRGGGAPAGGQQPRASSRRARWWSRGEGSPCPAPSPCLPGRAAWSSSPTAAAAAATARATGRWRRRCSKKAWPRCSSTCSPRRRRPTGPTCSTSRCWGERLAAATAWLRRSPAGVAGLARGLLRGQHRRRGGVVGRRRRSVRGRGRQPGRPPRPGRAPPRGGSRPHAAHRRRTATRWCWS